MAGDGSGAASLAWLKSLKTGVYSAFYEAKNNVELIDVFSKGSLEISLRLAEERLSNASHPARDRDAMDSISAADLLCGEALQQVVSKHEALASGKGG